MSSYFISVPNFFRIRWFFIYILIWIDFKHFSRLDFIILQPQNFEFFATLEFGRWYGGSVVLDSELGKNSVLWVSGGAGIGNMNLQMGYP